ncbi:mechanosensitive ion channel family protein [Reinekea sp.]|jgi:MscS family membrane protein|uniref:mechanosensitive ion channel family protein n=1 Tax=Reinekea sp. TaxID=1970455 RepID=UPI002A7F2E6E|nr:mechanosensitive ion channel family protein [Reinekea sp.]
MEFFTSAVAELQRWLAVSAAYSWILQVFVIVLLTLVANYFVRKLFDRLASSSVKTSVHFDNMIVATARKPVRFFIWIFGMLLAADVVKEVSNEAVFDIIEPIREVSFIVLFAWFGVRFIHQGEEAVQRPGVLDNPMDATTASALGKLMRLSVIITTALVVLQALGFSVSGVLAFGGIGGIAVGFAAKDLLANFFGGLMIYLDQPFKVGDWVRSPDQEIEGTVENIGWRLTRIRTFDKRPLYVPNATFATISLENPSRMLRRRIKETIGIRYDDALKVEQIVAEVKQMLIDHEAIDNEYTMIVNVDAFAASSINFFIYTFTKTTDWIEFHAIKQDVMVKVIEIVARNKAEFAFPTQTLHIKHEPEG